MKYAFLVILFSVSVQVGFCQNNQLWKGYFSYNNIKDITQSDNKLYAASENAIFTKNTQTNEIKTINTVDGLSSQIISAVYHSPTFNKTLVGYENGFMVVINDTDGKILNVVDILNNQLPPNIKKINHFLEYNGIVYMSCDFGIVQYDLKNLQFGDTYFIGTTKPEIVVTQTAVLNGMICASTLTEGVKSAYLTNPNLIDATQWDQAIPGSFSGITSFSNNIFAASTSGQIVKFSDGSSFPNFGPTLSPAAVDIRTSSDKLLITTPNSVYVYNAQLALETQINNTQVATLAPVFTSAAIVGSTIYIGSQDQGVLAAPLSNPTTFDHISPSGPARNDIFSITVSGDNIWATYGGYDQYMSFLFKRYGFSKFNRDTGWLNIPFSQVDGAQDLVRITVNPKDAEQIFVSSYSGGLLKYENEQLVKHYNQTNSGLETIPVTGNTNVVTEESVFDKAGNLWISNGLVDNSLKVLTKGGQWQSYNMKKILDNTFAARLGRMTIDKNETKWISTLSDGLVGFNESKNLYRKITVTEGTGTGNLPNSAVQVAAIDNRNQIWIGTRLGLRVLSSVDQFFSNQTLNTVPIIILDNGIAQELMYQQFITDIVVDGANNKWISTAQSGVFLLSPNGQQTLYHFTSSNSPLPNNNVNDIDINNATGEVFFATANGMVSFKGTARGASENLDNVVVFPNPVRPEFQGTVKITGLLDKADIKITDIEGNLVHEEVAQGGSIEWDTTAFGKYRVQSGVYMIFVSSQDGTETQVKKVMIVR